MMMMDVSTVISTFVIQVQSLSLANRCFIISFDMDMT